MEWDNEPARWREEGAVIVVTAQAGTDYWRKTHNDAVRDNGHLYAREVTGDFVAEVTVSGEYAAQYDQAGLMVRLDEATWLKCGVELLDGVQQASVVVTRDYSDWSVLPLARPPAALALRVVRQGGTIEVFCSPDGAAFTLLRQAHLTAAPVRVGVMCAAPTGPGFTAKFTGFSVRSAGGQEGR